LREREKGGKNEDPYALSGEKKGGGKASSPPMRKKRKQRVGVREKKRKRDWAPERGRGLLNSYREEKEKRRVTSSHSKKKKGGGPRRLPRGGKKMRAFSFLGKEKKRENRSLSLRGGKKKKKKGKGGVGERQTKIPFFWGKKRGKDGDAHYLSGKEKRKGG